MEERNSPAAKILVMLAIVLLPLLAYSGGYFWTSYKITALTPQLRSYRYRWQAAIFLPAAKVESYLSGSETTTGSLEESNEAFGLPP